MPSKGPIARFRFFWKLFIFIFSWLAKAAQLIHCTQQMQPLPHVHQQWTRIYNQPESADNLPPLPDCHDVILERRKKKRGRPDETKPKENSTGIPPVKQRMENTNDKADIYKKNSDGAGLLRSCHTIHS